MSRIKHYNHNTQQWEYSDVSYSIQQGSNIDYEEVNELINDAIKDKANRSEVESHVADKNNPHEVTAEQVGAATIEYVNSLTKVYVQTTAPENPKDGDIWVDLSDETTFIYAEGETF